MSAMVELIQRWEGVIGWLCVATFCKFVLKWSAQEVIAAFMKEIRDSSAKKRTVAGINGMFIGLMGLLFVLMLATPSFFRLFTSLQSIPVPAFDPNKTFMAMVIGGTMSLVCVLRAGPSK